MCSDTAGHAGLKVELLGQLMVTRDGLRQELPRSRKTRGLLAYLAVSRRVHGRADLCALLWEGASDPRGELRWSLAKLKAVVGPALEVSREGVGLASHNVFVDATEFRSVAERQVMDRSLAGALALWRGTPFADVDVERQPAFHAWMEAEREALGGHRTTLLKAAVDATWAQPENALAAARRLVAHEPWNEWGHGRVVQLLERCGRTSEAREHVASTRRRLSTELAVHEAEILMALPATPSVHGDVPLSCNRRRARPVVRLERLKIVSSGGPAAGIAVRVAAALNAVLWQRACCEVVDAELGASARAKAAVDPDFSIRGAVVREVSAAFLSLRLVNTRLGTVVWSCQDELQDLTSTGVSTWVEDSVDAMAAAFRSGRHEAVNPHDIRNRLSTAAALAGALEPAANQQALELLKGILAEDAGDATALALASWCFAQRAVYNWSDNTDRERQEARYYAAAAMRDGIEDPRVLTTIATARMLVSERNAAQVLLERALRLNNRSSHAHTRSGWLANYADDPEAGARHFQRAIKLAPLDAGVFNAYAGLGAAHFIQGDYVQAIRRMEQGLALNPKALWIQRNLVPAYAAIGDRRSAQDGVEALTKGYANLTISDITGAMVFSAPVLARIASGLRESGLPV